MGFGRIRVDERREREGQDAVSEEGTNKRAEKLSFSAQKRCLWSSGDQGIPSGRTRQ